MNESANSARRSFWIVLIFTYPVIANLFKEGPLYNDLLWDEEKPMIPPKAAKIAIMRRFLRYKLYDKADKEFVRDNLNMIYREIGQLDPEEKHEIEFFLKSS